MDREQINVTPEEKNDGTTSLFTPDKQAAVFRATCDLYDKFGRNPTLLSRVTGVSDRAITRYFADKTKNPHFYTLCTMIIAMGGDVNEVLGIAPPKAAEVTNPYGELITAYQEHTKSLTASLDRMASRTKILSVAVAALALVVLGFLCIEIIDLCHGDWGRYESLMRDVSCYISSVL